MERIEHDIYSAQLNVCYDKACPVKKHVLSNLVFSIYWLLSIISLKFMSQPSVMGYYWWSGQVLLGFNPDSCIAVFHRFLFASRESVEGGDPSGVGNFLNKA